MKKTRGTLASLLPLLGVALWLAGCAAPADPTKMVVAPLLTDGNFPPALVKAMCVRGVTGGSGTNPMWVSKVGNEEFKAALTASMEKADLIAPAQGCKYPTDVNLLGLSQPIAGLDMEVTSHANYKVYDAANQPVLQETISAPYTAKFGEHAIAIYRLQKANEGSIRKSISMFLDKLRATKIP